MKKKIPVIVTAVALVALIAVGGTLAFFTDKGEVTNVITMGDVNIKLEEPIFSSSDMTTKADDGSFVKKGLILPGSSFVKDPTITNIGSNPCYIRSKVSLVMKKNNEVIINNIITKADKTKITITPEDFFQANTGWVQSTDGYYYYNTVVPATGVGKVVELFKKAEDGKTIHVPTAWGNEIADITFSLNVSAEAIQAENFKPHMNGTAIDGWKYSNSSDVEVQSAPSISSPVSSQLTSN